MTAVGDTAHNGVAELGSAGTAGPTPAAAVHFPWLPHA